MPTSWRDWRDMFENIIIKPWLNRGESITRDANPLRAHYGLHPCRIWPHSIRVPPPVALRSAGDNAEWWERWNPIAHYAQYPGGRENPSTWAIYTSQPDHTAPIIGRGAVSAQSAIVLGIDVRQDCSHMWRPIGPGSELTSSYAANL